MFAIVSLREKTSEQCDRDSAKLAAEFQGRFQTAARGLDPRSQIPIPTGGCRRSRDSDLSLRLVPWAYAPRLKFAVAPRLGKFVTRRRRASAGREADVRRRRIHQGHDRFCLFGREARGHAGECPRRSRLILKGGLPERPRRPSQNLFSD